MDNSSSIEAKRSLRKEMRRVRAGLIDREGRSESISSAVLALCDRVAIESDPDRAPKLLVLGFVGIGTEPDTSWLLDALVAHGHVVALPRVEGERIVAVSLHPDAEMTVGDYGIPAPSGAAIDPALIDVVLVPGLAFTIDGRRLGQGGGYYDRFLPLLRDDCVTCGVCFSEQIVVDVPSEPHDRTLSTVITDSSTIGDVAR